MIKHLHDFSAKITTSPYIYVVLLIFLVVVIIVFRKPILSLFRHLFSKARNGFKISTIKKQEFTFRTNDEKPDLTSTTIRKVDMQNSEIESIAGNIKIDNVKMKDSHIGDIRSD